MRPRLVTIERQSRGQRGPLRHAVVEDEHDIPARELQQFHRRVRIAELRVCSFCPALASVARLRPNDEAILHRTITTAAPAISDQMFLRKLHDAGLNIALLRTNDAALYPLSRLPLR